VAAGLVAGAAEPGGQFLQRGDPLTRCEHMAAQFVAERRVGPSTGLEQVSEAEQLLRVGAVVGPSIQSHHEVVAEP
jgi:hypothetical protein